jgi:protein-tyrosine-phosphatase
VGGEEVTANLNEASWTYGVEHEFADWDTRNGVPEGFDWGGDWTVVNSNGIAVDPPGQIYPYGGEVRTPPTSTPEAQGGLLREFLLLQPKASVNYRSNLHVHVRVPGLREDLDALKRLLSYNVRQLPSALDFVDPIPEPLRDSYVRDEDYRGAVTRFRRRQVSHHQLPLPRYSEAQLAATTVEEFFAAEVPRSRAGKTLWHARPRSAVNLRQLLQTDTIEFRHFPGTLDPKEVIAAARWARAYLRAALMTGETVEDLSGQPEFLDASFPRFCPYDHGMEMTYRATSRHHVGVEKARRGIWERIGEVPPRRPVVLVVCLGNAYRSPAASAVIAQFRPDLDVRSGGFRPLRHVGAKMRRSIGRYGSEISKRRPTGLTKDLVRAADVILAMNPTHCERLVEEFGAERDRVRLLASYGEQPQDRILDPGSKREASREWREIVEQLVGASRGFAKRYGNERRTNE